MLLKPSFKSWFNILFPHFTNKVNYLGSGIVRRFKELLGSDHADFSRYSYEGPMSFHRGCIQIDFDSADQIFGVRRN